MTAVEGAGGDCFQVAVRIAEQAAPISNPTIVHGLPIGRGPLNAGKRYWHAWVEVEDSTGITVIDRPRGETIMLPQGMYYNMGRIEQTWRFTLAEARAEMVERGHWGPWVDDYEKVCPL